jgi:hypothetical protein
MNSAAYYRAEAERARAAAENSQDPAAATRWLSVAKGYQTLAEKMSMEEAKLSPAMRLPSVARAERQP